MSTDIAPTFNESPSPRCSGITRAGKQCKAYALPGSTLCRGHSMSEEEKAALRAASVRAKRERVEAREAAVEASRMGVQALMGRELEARAEAVVSRMVDLALSADDGVALQGLKLLLERVHGRAVQPTQQLEAEMPAELAALRLLSPEELRSLFHAVPPPESD